MNTDHIQGHMNVVRVRTKGAGMGDQLCCTLIFVMGAFMVIISTAV